MDKEAEVKFESIQKSVVDLVSSVNKNIDEFKAQLQKFMDKDEKRRDSITELANSLELHCKDCDYNRRNYMTDLKNVADKVRLEKEEHEKEHFKLKQDIKEIKEAPGKTFKTAREVVAFANGLTPWVLLIAYAVLKKLGVL